MKSVIDTTKLTRSEIIKERLFECIHNGEVENIQLWQIFDHVTDILGLCSVKEYSERHKVSEQYSHRLPHKIKYGVKLIIDNK
jgi:hypothetical protein